MIDFARLERLLRVNYAALGFELLGFEKIKQGGHNFARYQFKCPCGGVEALSFAYDPALRAKCDLTVGYAKRAMEASASYHHLKADVDDGTLPPFDIEKHVFKQLIEVD